jgi:hypothetical protein
MLRPLPAHSARQERRSSDRIEYDIVASAEREMFLRLLGEKVIEENVCTAGGVRTGVR